MKYAPLIWAALLRRPAESILTWLAVTVAFTLFALMIGLNATYRGTIEANRADRLFVNARFNGIEGLPYALHETLQKIDGVVAVSGAQPTCGYHIVPRDTVCVYFSDQDTRVAWSQLPIAAAEWDKLLATRDGVLMSRILARKWGVREGDTFTMTTAPGFRSDGSTGWPLKVVGVVAEDPGLWNGAFIIGNLGYWEEVRALDKRGRVGVFNLALRDGARSGATCQLIERMYANSGTPTQCVSARADALALAHSDIDMASMTWVIAGAGLFMILFLTANGIARSVRERTREFAVLKTVGFPHRDVALIVFLEAAIPCVAGALAGTALAAIIVRWQVRFLPANLFVPQPTVSLAVVGAAVVCALGLALIGSLVPVGKLRRLQVAAALAGQ